MEDINSSELPTVEPNPVYLNPELPVADRVENLLAQMTLAEKIGQMTLVEKGSLTPPAVQARFIGGVLSGGGGYPQPNTPEAWREMVNGFQEQALATRLGIPLLYGVDAIHGHNNVVGAVIFPHNIGLGAANDPALMKLIGRATAEEMAATGIFWNYAPVLAVPQDIRWGRTYEGFSENTERVTALSTAFLEGQQGTDLSEATTVLGTPKHYVGDGATAFGTSTQEIFQRYLLDQGDAQIDEATLRRIHLPPYQAAVNAGARSIMVSFSSWNGVKLHGQPYLLTEVLKGELGFTGFLVSDWGGIDQISNNYYDAVVTAINAGIDMNMVPYDYELFIETLTEAVANEAVPLARIDDAVKRILTVKFELGLFERPLGDQSLLSIVGLDEHRALARQAVSESLVLLKNEGQVLPIPSEVETVLVGGPAADDIGIQSGGWTIEWQGLEGEITPGTTVLEGIEAGASESTTVYYEPTGKVARVLMDDGSTLAPDLCLGVVGERPYAEGVGDSADLALPKTDLTMLANMRAGCDNLVVVLLSGRPVIVTPWLEEWDALVAAWLPGTEGGGVADVLFGEVAFSGKLPYTWPSAVDQLPFDFDNLDIGDPGVLFPFGYGLEY
jgi:beta-glucosidase